MTNDKMETKKKRERNTRKNKRNARRKILNDERLWCSDPAIEETVEALFAKRFELINNESWKLPDPDAWFVEKVWNIDDLQRLKKELNETKSRLNDYDLTEWSLHTRRRNKAGKVHWELQKRIRPELLTQAWCKFYENISSFDLIAKKCLTEKKLNSVHLCEAPGAFVASLNHWLKLNAPDVCWNWMATTLNPHYEGNSTSTMINDDRFVSQTLDNWYFGADNTGDLMNLKNLKATVDKVGKEVTLVTADGSIDCSDSPGEQEEAVSQLLYCQVVAALNLLDDQGNFLLKCFTIFENRTVCLIYLLSRCFEKIYFNKPVTSKEGNSEIYIVCLKFVGSNFLRAYEDLLAKNYEKMSEMSMFRRSDVPNDFIEQIIKCGKFFKTHQCDVITNNVRTFVEHSVGIYDDNDDLNLTKNLVANRFIDRYNLHPLALETLEIVGKKNLSNNVFATKKYRSPLDSFNVRQNHKNLTAEERLTLIIDKFEFVSTDIENIFQLIQIPDELCITTGKPYARIKNSKFCEPSIMEVYNRFNDIVDEMGFDETIPSFDSIERLNGQDNYRNTVVFSYTNDPNNLDTIKLIWKTLTNFPIIENLTFVGYPLLSQFNVGILHILARNFETVEFSQCVELGCVIRLKKFRNDEIFLNLVRTIHEISNEAEKKGEAVLSVLPLSWLCDSILYRHIVNVNHLVISHCVRKISQIIGIKN